MNTIFDDSLARAGNLGINIEHPVEHEGLYYVAAYHALLVIRAVNPDRGICQGYKIPEWVRRKVYQHKRYLYCLADCLALKVRGRTYRHTEETKKKMRQARRNEV